MNDESAALREFEAAPLALPTGLELEWLGVSGYRMTYEGQTIFIDPYVSRVSLKSFLLRRDAMPDAAMIERYIKPHGEVVGVIVGHTHFDHAIDAPAIAKRFGCKVYGSASMAQLMKLHGAPELAVNVEPGRVYEIGPFRTTFIRSAHSKLILGRKIPFDGELTCDDLHGLTAGGYKCGQVWGVRIEVAGVSFYHQGSADLLDDELPAQPVDYFLAGVAGREVTPNYWERVLKKLDPKFVVPTHYDNFFKPLGTPEALVARSKLAQLPDEIHAVSRDATIAALRRTDA
ncbi:MAG: MBL fold metallo-hydrolase [Thermoleophilaceae bacterium]|nr:MBL fold metallo-hydrolase [Thermoleophilaceae bacterium]